MPAFAHTNDPETSHQAAASITESTLRERQQAVLSLLRKYGPQTGTEVDDAYFVVYGKRTSYSGLKTRITELVRMGLVRDSGQRKLEQSGRNHIKWEAIPAAEIDPDFIPPLTRKEQADKDQADLKRYRNALLQIVALVDNAKRVACLPGNRGHQWHAGQLSLAQDIDAIVNGS